MKIVLAVLLAVAGLGVGCARHAASPSHTTFREFESGDYEIEIRSAIVSEDPNAAGSLQPLQLDLTGLAVRRGSADALVRPKHWIRIDSVKPAQSAQPVSLREVDDEFRPGELGHSSMYSADLRGTTHSMLIGRRNKQREWVRKASRVAGTVVIYEAKAIDGRLLEVQNAIEDDALLRVVPGVYVGITEVSQEEGEFAAKLRFWVSKPMRNERGDERLLGPSVPLAYSVPSHGDLHPRDGLVPRGWATSEITVPVLIEIEFLNQTGEVIHTQPENSGVLNELDAATLGEIDVRFPLCRCDRITHFNPVVIVSERTIEIPFEIDIKDLKGVRGFKVGD